MDNPSSPYPPSTGAAGQRAEPDRIWRPALLRGALMLLGTLVLATGFIVSYVGALHDPRPRDLPVAVVGTDQPARTLLAAVRQHGRELAPIAYPDRGAADRALHRRDVYAVLESGPAGGAPGLTLTTASGAAPFAAQAIGQLVSTAAQRAQVPLVVRDAIPVAAGDPRGLVPFYLGVGFVLGGYLGSVALAITLGPVPAGLSRAAVRIGALAVHSALLGLAGALVVGPGLDVFPGDFGGLVGTGALVAFAAAMATAAVQSWLGLPGTALVILVLVVLGNPGSGGVYAPEFLPDFFRAMHRWNIPGLATDMIKSVAYFGADAARWPAGTLAIWAVVGAAVLVAASTVRGRRRSDG
ncbi:hypothetical protein [Plantactinospora sp. CA-290183]|uniref:hypothetical protein n=1 Tax=Plantactinospora sp. CA-290183 TaxID=3240006 RepID=UPI003D8A22FE